MAVHPEQLRNIALVSHNGAGKTSLAEIMLYKAGKSTRVGRVEDGNTVLDSGPDEIERMRKAGTLAWTILNAVEDLVRPGISTQEIDDLVAVSEDELRSARELLMLAPGCGR